ncbi:helix-turn-helix transcriptional regulator [Actinospica durhamensis]|uniref:HTH-type transcriptional regulator RipA n=1 Tax=Actinospica durhamensis TaxID=1508375 RepID=A0A941ETP3_9ACTN|nr:helix-turn-helix transcriptional regulator [Actinospica durhamensis]MBR7837038.1 helix-turn-helix transcriptional regulator [Actinospica durhamensis]
MSVNRLDLSGPTRRSLLSGELIDWHDHSVNQLCYPLRGVLEISTPLGVWVVPSHRAVWIPAGVPHAHRAYGATEMRTLVFPQTVNPLRLDRPTVLATDPLLREVIVALSEAQDPDGVGRPQADELDATQRHHLELVALDRLRLVEELAFSLPAPQDDRLRAVAALLTADPADERSLAELGRVVGAAERTLSRLFRTELGMSFPQWRGQLRLQRALTLLAAGSSVTTVAGLCGFRSPSAFIDAFRRAFGTTPGRYRESARPRPGAR